MSSLLPTSTVMLMTRSVPGPPESSVTGMAWQGSVIACPPEAGTHPHEQSGDLHGRRAAGWQSDSFVGQRHDHQKLVQVVPPLGRKVSARPSWRAKALGWMRCGSANARSATWVAGRADGLAADRRPPCRRNARRDPVNSRASRWRSTAPPRRQAEPRVRTGASPYCRDGDYG